MARSARADHLAQFRGLLAVPHLPGWKYHRQSLGRCDCLAQNQCPRSEEHTSELQSLMRISYAVFCLKKQKQTNNKQSTLTEHINSTIATINIIHYQKCKPIHKY